MSGVGETFRAVRLIVARCSATNKGRGSTLTGGDAPAHVQDGRDRGRSRRSTWVGAACARRGDRDGAPGRAARRRRKHNPAVAIMSRAGLPSSRSLPRVRARARERKWWGFAGGGVAAVRTDVEVVRGGGHWLRGQRSRSDRWSNEQEQSAVTRLALGEGQDARPRNASRRRREWRDRDQRARPDRRLECAERRPRPAPSCSVGERQDSRPRNHHRLRRSLDQRARTGRQSEHPLGEGQNDTALQCSELRCVDDQRPAARSWEKATRISE